MSRFKMFTDSTNQGQPTECSWSVIDKQTRRIVVEGESYQIASHVCFALNNPSEVDVETETGELANTIIESITGKAL